MDAFALAFLMSLVAEFGDKSQLLILGYATRFTVQQMVLGIVLGASSVLFFPALLGGWIGQYLPFAWIHALSAVIFFVFAIKVFGHSHEEKSVEKKFPYPILTIAVTLFLVEFGDKTMLTTMTLATSYSWIPVWLGSALGMTLADIGAVVVGRLLHKTIPEKQIRWLSAVLFFAFAVWSALKAFRAWHS